MSIIISTIIVIGGYLYSQHDYKHDRGYLRGISGLTVFFNSIIVASGIILINDLG